MQRISSQYFLRQIWFLILQSSSFIFHRFKSKILRCIRWVLPNFNAAIALKVIDQSAVWIFFSAEFFMSFLNKELSLSIHRLLILNCELLHLDFVELALFGISVVFPRSELGDQLGGGLSCEYWWFSTKISLRISLWLVQLFFAKASLLMESFVVLFLVISWEIPDDLVFGWAPSFSWREPMLSLSRPISGCQITGFSTRNCRRGNFCHWTRRGWNWAHSRVTLHRRKIVRGQIFKLFVGLTTCRRGSFSKLAKHASWARVRSRVFAIRDCGRHVVDVEGAVCVHGIGRRCWVAQCHVCKLVMRFTPTTESLFLDTIWQGNVLCLSWASGRSWACKDNVKMRACLCWSALALEMCRCGLRIVYTRRRSLTVANLLWPITFQSKGKFKMTLRQCLATFVLAARCPGIPLAVVAPPRLPSLLSPSITSCKIARVVLMLLRFSLLLRIGETRTFTGICDCNSVSFLKRWGEFRTVGISAMCSTSTCLPLQNIKLPVSVPLLLAAMVRLIIGTQTPQAYISSMDHPIATWHSLYRSSLFYR